jgi:hypothetical protein
VLNADRVFKYAFLLFPGPKRKKRAGNEAGKAVYSDVFFVDRLLIILYD